MPSVLRPESDQINSFSKLCTYMIQSHFVVHQEQSILPAMVGAIFMLVLAQAIYCTSGAKGGSTKQDKLDNDFENAT